MPPTANEEGRDSVRSMSARRIGAAALVFLLLLVAIWTVGAELVSRVGVSRETARGVLLALFFASLAVWLIPSLQVRRWKREGIKKDKLAELGNDARTTITQALSGLALVATLALTAYQVGLARQSSEDNVAIAGENLRITEEGQVTDRLSRAIDQLGATNIKGRPAVDIRVGGLFSLLRIGEDSKRDTYNALFIAGSYVKNNLGPWTQKQALVGAPCSERRAESRRLPRADVAVALRFVLTGLGFKLRNELSAAEQKNTAFPALEGVNFTGRDLTGIAFTQITLSGSSFRNADLTEAQFNGAFLGDVDFRGACLERADFRKVGYAENLDLRGADLSDAEVTPEIRSSSRTDSETKW